MCQAHRVQQSMCLSMASRFWVTHRAHTRYWYFLVSWQLGTLRQKARHIAQSSYLGQQLRMWPSVQESFFQRSLIYLCGDQPSDLGNVSPSQWWKKEARTQGLSTPQGEQGAQCTDLGHSRAPLNIRPGVRGWLWCSHHSKGINPIRRRLRDTRRGWFQQGSKAELGALWPPPLGVLHRGSQETEPWAEAVGSCLVSILPFFLMNRTWITSRHQYARLKDSISHPLFLQGLANEKANLSEYGKPRL